MQAAQALGVKAVAIQADSADAEALVAAVERTAVELGGLDILVNNAGMRGDGTLGRLQAGGLRPDDRDRGGVVHQAAARHMQSGGRVINIGSTNAERMPFPVGAVYAMSKSALQGLVRLSRDLGR